METAQLAIEYTLLCKDRKLSIEILVKKIESLGLSCSKIEHQAKGICIDLSEEIGFYLFLFDVGNYPYNSWETTFLTEDFTFERTLQFRMDKGYFDIEKRYGVMLRIWISRGLCIHTCPRLRIPSPHTRRSA